MTEKMPQRITWDEDPKIERRGFTDYLKTNKGWKPIRVFDGRGQGRPGFFVSPKQSGELDDIIVQSVLFVVAPTHAGQPKTPLPAPVKDPDGLPSLVRFKVVGKTSSLYLGILFIPGNACWHLSQSKVSSSPPLNSQES